ncbi:MAG: enoyl-CoA hydratase-related protein [Acidimicrobiia bacterium]|nr:enoyl-CoA hydratase-related protein [Acidimicrobiia bacterium]
MIRHDSTPPRATITIDDPERHNPLSATAMAELAATIDRAAADPAVRVIVVTGAGDKAFSAGGDLAGDFVDDPMGHHADRAALADAFRALRKAGKPTIARINGHALGGGFGVAVACDIGIAVDTAALGMPEINVGLWPMMVIAVVQRAMPHKAALELMMTGRRLSADEAMSLGLVSRVVESSDLDAVVDETVDALSSKSSTVLQMGRDAFYGAQDMDFDAALDYLHNGLTAVALTDDAAEGVAAFLEKREPNWSGS